MLAAIVAFHELGHFTAARLQGIHVSKFSVGFGPALYSWKVGFTVERCRYALRLFMSRFKAARLQGIYSAHFPLAMG